MRQKTIPALTILCFSLPSNTVIKIYHPVTPCLISNLMHKILIYIHIIHLLKSSTCFENYPAHLQEVHIVIVYMQPLVSSQSDDTE